MLSSPLVVFDHFWKDVALRTKVRLYISENCSPFDPMCLRFDLLMIRGSIKLNKKLSLALC